MPVRRVLHVVADEAGEYRQAIVEIFVVGDDEVGVFHVGPNVALVSGQDVVLVAIQYVFQRVVAFYLIAFDAPNDFQVFFGMQKHLEIEHVAHFFEVKHEDAFHHDDRRRSEHEGAGFGLFVVEHILQPRYRFAGDEFL